MDMLIMDSWVSLMLVNGLAFAILGFLSLFKDAFAI